MSSPQITRMFGFFASWAWAGSADTTASAEAGERESPTDSAVAP